jgi:hypothetical protein
MNPTHALFQALFAPGRAGSDWIDVFDVFAGHSRSPVFLRYFQIFYTICVPFRLLQRVVCSCGAPGIRFAGIFRAGPEKLRGQAMSAQGSATTVEVFSDRAGAEKAIRELIGAGFKEEQIRIIPEYADPRNPAASENAAGFGLLTGASLGGLTGGPIGLLSGAVVGGLVGALIDLGVPEAEARFYEEELVDKGAVVTVQGDGRGVEAREILDRNGGRAAPPKQSSGEEVAVP